MQAEGRQLTSRKGHGIIWRECVGRQRFPVSNIVVRRGWNEKSGIWAKPWRNSQTAPSQKKQVLKGQEFCTTKPSLSPLVRSKFFRLQKSYFSFPPRHKCIHCLITAIIKCWGMVFYINRKNSLETVTSVLSEHYRIQLSDSFWSFDMIMNKCAPSIYPFKDSRVNLISKCAETKE